MQRSQANERFRGAVMIKGRNGNESAIKIGRFSEQRFEAQSLSFRRNFGYGSSRWPPERK
jgi:hypothetical protein